MDEPGCVPDAWPGEGSWRVQFDGARLQSQAGAQHRPLHRVDGRSAGCRSAGLRMVAGCPKLLGWTSVAKPTGRVLTKTRLRGSALGAQYWSGRTASTSMTSAFSHGL